MYGIDNDQSQMLLQTLNLNNQFILCFKDAVYLYYHNLWLLSKMRVLIKNILILNPAVDKSYEKKSCIMCVKDEFSEIKKQPTKKPKIFYQNCYSYIQLQVVKFNTVTICLKKCKTIFMLNLNITWLIVFALKISAVFVDMLYCTVCISDFNIPLQTRK